MKNHLLKKIAMIVVFIFYGNAYAQTITGTVSDSDGPLPEASVVVKGTANGTTTGFDGKFTLNNVASDATLVVSYLGYATLEVKVNGQKTLSITLKEDANQLDEIVVVGYGTQKRAKLTAAVSSVKGTDLAELPSADVAQSLQGRAAGVNVINSGSPGGKTTINIRGLGTIGTGDPLYVVDGVFTNSIDAINPASIKNVDILKDAAAAAIYGSRGANGVIIVTTKKGTKGKTTFKASSYTGVQFNNNRIDVLNTAQYVQFLKEVNAQTDGGGQTVNVIANNPGFDGNGVDTNWQDEFFRSAPITNYEFSASGGSENTSFNVGASSFSQEGIYIDTEFKRNTFNASSEFNITEKFKVGETLNFSISDRIAPQLSDGREPLFNLLAAAPYIPVRNPDGTFGGASTDDGNNSRNQLRVQDSDDNLSRNTSVIGSIYGEYELLEGLTFKTQLGLDLSFSNFDAIFRSYDEVGGQFSKDDTNVSKFRGRNLSKIFTNSLTYDKTFDEKHNFNLVLVSERQDSKYEGVSATSTTTLSNVIQEINEGNSSSSSFTNKEILISYLGRLNYDYDGKYLASFSLRRDKSSRLAPGNQSGTFKAGSLGWVASKEPFLENHESISNLKIRASYGETGNNNIGINRYAAVLRSVFIYPEGGNGLVSGTAPFGIDNPNLTWEVSIKQNYGFDLGLHDNKYTFSAEYFNNRTENLLVEESLPTSLGVTPATIAKNIGDIETSGMEFTFGYNDYEGDFKWNAWASLSTYETTMNRLASNSDEFFTGNFVPRQTDVARLAVGEPLYHFYGYVYEGVYSTNQDITDHLGADNLDDTSGAAYVVQQGDARYKDVNGDGDIDADDRVIIGNPNPDFTFNINLKAEYKGFDASALITGVQGADAFNGNVFNLSSQERILNYGTDVLRRWQQPGDVTDIPRYRFGVNDNNEISTRYIEDASYTRLKNLTVGYTINPDKLKNIFNGAISRVRFYVQGQNLITLTGYSGLDPEIEPYYSGNGLEGFGIDRGRAPQPTTLLTGLQIEF